MKQSKRLVNILMSCLLGLGACNCPPDVYLGDVKMVKPDFLPLKGGETLYFVNDNKETLVLVDASGSQLNDRITVENLCAHPPVSSQFSYYKGTPNYNLTYVNRQEILELHFRFGSINGSSTKDTAFYDNLSVELTSSTASLTNYASLDVLVSDRGNTKQLASKVDSYLEKVKMVRDTIIHNKRYSNVYYKVSDKSILYAEKLGLISFIHKNQRWYSQN